MMSEVVNALVITYLATEHAILVNSSGRGRSKISMASILKRNSKLGIGAAVVNVLDRVSGLKVYLSRATNVFYYTFKILMVILSFLLACYVDCRRIQHKLAFGAFLKTSLRAFLYVLPVYPFLAVLISFGFLFLIDIFEWLGIDPEKYLHYPIYYSTLYGPFAFVYSKIKQESYNQQNTLPSLAS